MFFHEATFQGSKVKDWPYFSLDTYNNYRLYYLPKSAEEKSGFDFVVFSFNECSGANNVDYWLDPTAELEVSPVLYGHASDQVRHIYSGNNDTAESDINKIKPEGYTYYPDTLIMERVYKNLRELENKYCYATSDTKLVAE